VAHGRQVTQLVQSSDFSLTCLDFAGGDVRRDAFDTRSLRPLLNPGRPGEMANRTVVCATTMGWPMMRRGSLKYMVHQESGTGALFDLDADAGETINVLDDPAYSSLADELRGLLDAELARRAPGCRWAEP
jgi:arylsulfatase A-like enzyme